MKLDAIRITALWFLLGCTDNPGVEDANSIPHAEAGPDQQVAFTGVPAEVWLDGRGSTDTDGSLIAFRWLSATAMPGGARGRYVPPNEAADWPADAPQVKVLLPEGVWRFSLQVIDDRGSTSIPDVVTVTVGTPPAGVGGASGVAGTGAGAGGAGAGVAGAGAPGSGGTGGA